ncbi:MAG: hypothetical protein COX90_00490 [Candidatus Nealsonbacteria bacterium CG_4_10_14_0_2_um_filter_38_17]|uniref:4Fe-4S ferredoxin-type domain-containing protein n=1 Tax=Candidatus Nealsonbacteria bacterium CG_4_10_14_0_2_um_filter_38_17 TaxID=1974680 RepID=A0A2M7UZ26_9BACT|nr:MAG: hypothetical protein COX90_00490 [Candidatus Nealsonbacteria bacterium CG_4_10_14_0_2_um_filter_38_17]
MKAKNLKFLLAFLFFSIFGVSLVLAAGQGNMCDSCGVSGDLACAPNTELECREGKCRPICTGVCIENPLKACSFEDLIETIINFIFIVALAIAPLMILVAAFYFISAGGDPKRINTAKHIMLYAIIGLVVIFFAKGLIDVIKYILGAS